MAKHTIIFRADGGLNIGMGHFIRTLALANMLNQSFNCVFATCNPTEYQIREMDAVCHQTVILSNDESHFTKFLNILNGDEIVVLDNYFFSTDYQRSIRAKGCKLVCIDDLHDKHFVADIIINHSLGITPDLYSMEAYTKVLTGYDYALLRQPYLDDNTKSKNKVYGAIIMMGGADPLNLTSKIIQLLNQTKFTKPIAVVSKSEPSLTDWDSMSISHFTNLNASQVLELMQASEFGIFPASTVAIEACAARLPFICGYFVDNQTDIYNSIRKHSLAICIDNLTQLDENCFQNAIETITSTDTVYRITRKQKELLDKKSHIRLLNAFLQL